MIHRRYCLQMMSGAVVSLAAGQAWAQTTPVIRKSDSAKPFATHFIALQLSDADPKKQRLVLSVASNLIKEYGPDDIAVEVVAFGPGIALLTETSEFRALVDSLVTQGVRFDVCGNTLDTIERETGVRPKLNPHAVEVQVGVGQLLSLSENGYTIVRP